MENIISRYPNFLLLVGQFPLLAIRPKQLHGILLQISALIEAFLADEALLMDIAETPKQEANLLLEFAKGNDATLVMFVNMIPLANIKDIDDANLQEAIQNFLALTRLYIAKNKEVIAALESICEDATEFIRKHPATYQRLLKSLQNPTIGRTFEGNEFENFTQTLAI